MITKKVYPNDWKVLSEKAHLVVFGTEKKADDERIDFTLVAEENGIPCQYTTCRELDGRSLYFQYGGSFPGTKGTVKSLRAFRGFLRWAKENGYKRIAYYIENINRPMLKLALATGFMITGIRNFQGSVLVEHLLEF